MRTQETIAAKQADYERANLAAAVPLSLERAVKGGVPRRALLASISRVLSVTFVTLAAADVARNTAPTGTK
ncbi:MAG TPA: hypothetical protein VNM48_20515 [Chloroflexota bacterium]|nr:hypothetical protein [Chloroflexota bacterium]